MCRTLDEGGLPHVSVGNMAKRGIDFDDKNNLVQMVDVFEDSLAGERNPRIWAIPELCDLRPGGIIEIVHETTNHVEIQRDLRTSLNIHLKIVRKE